MIPFFFAFLHFFRVLRDLLKQAEFRALVTMVASTLALGAWFYHAVEGWDWLDSLYFCVVTLTTIGFGDLTPKTPLGKIFTMVYIFAGLGLLIGFIDAIGKELVQSRLKDTKTSAGAETKNNKT